MKKNKEYPIKAVSLKTDLSIHVIRAWEKRYNAVVPQRTDTNRRLYSESDIEKLILLKLCTEAGHNIGNVAQLKIDDLKEIVHPESNDALEISTPVNSFSESSISSYINKCIDAVKSFDVNYLEKTLFDASLQLSQPAFLDSVIIPLIKKIGNMWHDGDIRIMHEHMATATLKTFLSNMRNNYRSSENAPHIIVTTPIGQNHELGALILSLVAAVDGWNVTYLGPNLPAEEISMAVKETHAKAVILSIVYPADDHFLKRDLLKLGTLLSKKIKVIVGGRMSKNYSFEIQKIKALNIEDISGFREISKELKKDII